MIIFGTLYLILVFSSSIFAADESLKNYNSVIASYPLPNSTYANFELKDHKYWSDLKLGSYTVKAKIGLRKDSHPLVYKSIDLSPRQESSKFDYPKSPDSDTFISNPLYKEILPPIEWRNLNLSFSEFDELNLEYQDVDPTNPSLIRLEIVVSGENLEEKKTKVMVEGKYNPMILLNTEILSSFSWKKKSYRYLAKRTLDLTSDSSWQYIYKNKKIFFQKRFAFDLSKIEAIDLVFKNKADFEQIRALNCNLRIGFAFRIKPAKIVECKNFPQRFVRFDERMGFRLWIGDHIRSLFANQNIVYLDELIFFLPRHLSSEFTDQPLHSIQFQGLTTPQPLKAAQKLSRINSKNHSDPVLHFYHPVESPSAGEMRLNFPFKKISALTGDNSKIHSISIQHKNSDTSTEFRFQHLKILNYFLKDLPAIQNIGAHFSKRWGGPFFDLTDKTDKNEKFESVQVEAFYPFYSFPQKIGALYTQYTNSQLLEVKPSFKSPTNTFKVFGVQFKTDGLFYKSRPESQGIKLEGKGDWVEIYLPLNKRLEKNSRFFLGLLEGMANTLNIEVHPISQGRKLSPFFPSFNKPEKINIPPGKIDSFRIRINSIGDSFSFTIKEIALFLPVLLLPSEVFDKTIPIDTEFPLIPQNTQSVPQKEIHYLGGHLSTPLFSNTTQLKELSWETAIGRKMSRFRSLKISYKIPPAMQASNPCWLHITLAGNKQEAENTICPDKSADQLIIPSGLLFSNLENNSNETIESIKWKVSIKNAIPFSKLSWPLEISATLLGYETDTFRNHIANTPIISWNNKPYFPKSFKKIPSETLVKDSFWINLGSFEKIDHQSTPAYFNSLKHPHFHIEKIFLERAKPITFKEYQSLLAKQTEEKEIEENINTPIYQIALFILIIIGFLLFGRKLANFSIKWWQSIHDQDSSAHNIKKFIYSAITLYLTGYLLVLIKWRFGADFLLSTGSIVMVLAWHIFVSNFRPHIESTWPILARECYKRPGFPYITGFLLILLSANFFLLIYLNPVAEQLAIVAYCLLLIGIFLESRALWKKQCQKDDSNRHRDSFDEAPSA